jgi:hypothetical protein
MVVLGSTRRIPSTAPRVEKFLINAGEDPDGLARLELYRCVLVTAGLESKVVLWDPDTLMPLFRNRPMRSVVETGP